MKNEEGVVWVKQLGFVKQLEPGSSYQEAGLRDIYDIHDILYLFIQ